MYKVSSSYILFLIILSSCARHSLYVPTMPNTPNFNGTNKYQANVGLGLDHADLQIAASPINHIGFMGNAYLSPLGNNGDVSIGYYLTKNKMGFDLFAGIGGGSRNYNKESFGLTWSSKSDYTRWFVSNEYHKYLLQSSFYLTFDRGNQISFTIRSSFIQYQKFWLKTEIYEDGRSYPNPLLIRENRNNNLSVSCFDYIFTYKKRWKWIGWFIQPGIYANNGPYDYERSVYYYKPLFLSLNTGLNFYIGKFE